MRARIAALLLIASAALAACKTAGSEVKAPEQAAAAPVDAGPPAPIDLAPRREEAKALLHKQADLYWKNWTTGEGVDIAATYAGHDALFSREVLEQVQRNEAAEADPLKKRALTDFELYLLSEHISKELAPLADEIAKLQGTATMSVDGQEVAFRNLEPMLANESSHAKRVALSEAALPVLNRLNPLLERKQQETELLIKALGFASYDALSARMRDADLDALAKQADALLTSSNALYTKSMGDAVNRELRLELKDVRRADVPRFFHSAAVQSAFPAAQMMPRFTALLAGMGIDLDKLSGIRIDARTDPKKNPRAVCFPVSVPDDVRLSIKPRGGVDDYDQLFHEGGHALHYASTTTPVWEFQQLGNSTVTEAYAFLFQDRLEDPRYLSELGMTGELLNSYVRSAAVRKLYMLRRYAAKVLFEHAWHGAQPLTPEQLRARYKAIMERAYGFPLTDADVAQLYVDHDDFFYSADYLRAWFLAAQLDAALSAKYGERWWHAPEAGKQLQKLWASGNQPTADEVAQALGQKGLDQAPLLKQLAERLK